MVQSITRDPGYAQYRQQAGFLACRSTHQPPSRFPSDIMALLPAYSDEIAQDFHLLLFYPFIDNFFCQKRHLMLSYFIFNCSERLWILHALSRIIAHSDSKYKLFFGHSALAFCKADIRRRLMYGQIRSPVYH